MKKKNNQKNPHTVGLSLLCAMGSWEGRINRVIQFIPVRVNDKSLCTNNDSGGSPGRNMF